MNWQSLDADAESVLSAVNDWIDGFGWEYIHGNDIVFRTKKGPLGSVVHYFSWEPHPLDKYRHIMVVTWHVCCDEHHHVIEDVTLTKERK